MFYLRRSNLLLIGCVYCYGSMPLYVRLSLPAPLAYYFNLQQELNEWMDKFFISIGSYLYAIFWFKKISNDIIDALFINC